MKEPIHILSLGAGVQSSTLALMAKKGEVGPMPVAAVFADTKHEPAEVYRWLDWLEPHLPFPVIRVSAGDLAKKVTTPYWSEKNKKITTSGIPAFTLNEDGSQGIMSRQCTRDFKISPVDKEITRQMRIHHATLAVKWLAITTDEVSRVKPSRRSTVTHRHPFITDHPFSRYDCLRWMEANGFPKPPRSACIFCPYRKNSEWRRLTPDEFKRAVQFEKDLQGANKNGTLSSTPWLHRKMIPLDQVDLSTEEERGQLSMFNNECEGMCGV